MTAVSPARIQRSTCAPAPGSPPPVSRGGLRPPAGACFLKEGYFGTGKRACATQSRLLLFKDHTDAKSNKVCSSVMGKWPIRFSLAFPITQCFSNSCATGNDYCVKRSHPRAETYSPPKDQSECTEASRRARSFFAAD